MEPDILEPSLAADEVRQRIAQRAFQLYEARGREDGHDLEDWLLAEAELRRDRIQPRASMSAAVYED
jgi:Protein of unknown function (DUF2934)